MLFECCQCGSFSPKQNLIMLPKKQVILKRWIEENNLKIKRKGGEQFLCKSHLSGGRPKKMDPSIIYSEPPASDGYLNDVKQEESQEEIQYSEPWIEPKQEQVNEVNYDDFPFEMEQNSYETYEEEKYSPNSYGMDCQPTSSTASTSSAKAQSPPCSASQKHSDFANLPLCYPKLTDNQIMTFCVKTSSNLSGETSFECGMCPEQFFESPDLRPVRLHLETNHSITVNNFVKTGKSILAPKAYSLLSAAVKNEADESLCKFFIRNGLPLRTVKDPNLEMLTFNMNSSYKLPSIDKLSECLERIALNRMNTKIQAEVGPVTVTFDTTSFNNRQYLAFTVHYYQNKNKKNQTIFLREFNMTHSIVTSIMSTIRNAMDESNIRLPISTVVAGKIEYVEALENMESFTHVMACFSESLNKFAEALIEHPVFAIPLKTLREFIQKFPTRRNDWSRFKAYVVRKRTYGEYPEVDEGHWFTTLDFITKCLHMHRLFSEFNGSNEQIKYISVEDNVNIVYLHSLLNLCKAAFKTVSESRWTIADVIPAISEIRDSLNITTSSQTVIEAVNEMFNSILLPFITHSDYHRFAIFLHPLRYGTNCLPNSEWSSIKASLAHYLEHFWSNDGTRSIRSFKERKSAEKEVAAFCTYVVRSAGIESDVVDWWTRHSTQFPLLHKFAKELYQIPAFAINASFYLGDYGLLTYSLNEAEVSKRRMILEASSDLVKYRSKGDVMCKPICVKRKRDTACSDDMWYTPVDLKSLQASEPLNPMDPTKRGFLQRAPAATLSSAALSSNRIYLSSHMQEPPPPPRPQRPNTQISRRIPIIRRPTLREQFAAMPRPIVNNRKYVMPPPYARPYIVKKEPLIMPVKTEAEMELNSSSAKKYFAVRNIPINGQRTIRTMNGKVIRLVSKPRDQLPVNTVDVGASSSQPQGKKIYFVRSKTGVTHRLQTAPQ